MPDNTCECVWDPGSSHPEDAHPPTPASLCEGCVIEMLSRDVRALREQMDDRDERLGYIMSAVQEVAFAFEALELATTLGEQSSAFDRLSNAMSDLETWHPRYDPDLGEIREYEG